MEGDKYATYTNEEWEEFVQQTEDGLEVPQDPYPYPDVGSLAFMKTLDHTLLKLDSTPSQFDDVCAEARVNSFATVCVRPDQVQQCSSNLKGSDVKISGAIGFHEGTYDLLHKLQETKRALDAGAQELDMVINYPELKARQYASIYKELATIRQQAPHPILLKLILETSQLDRHQIIAGCVMAAATNFDFVKTSTGFNGPGATEENVRLMATCCEKLALHSGGQRRMQVKASGGIKTLADAVTMLEAGASRLGTSGSVWIAKEAKHMVEKKGGLPGTAEVKNDRPAMQTRLFTDY